MPDSPLCPWCAQPLARMTLERFTLGHDPVPCPRCTRDVPRHMVQGLARL